jgi:thymidylate synthase (FAD)
MQSPESIRVHNHGHVDYVDHMGDDLRVANVARVSFNNWKDEFDNKDKRLINYLLEHEHTSPFRHCYVSYRVKAPIFVLRQWGKHQVGCAWNELSMRYVHVPEVELWQPSQWRKQAKNSKQGSSDEPFSLQEEADLDQAVFEVARAAVVEYNRMVEQGVAREQARTILPQSLYTTVIWTASLQAVLHFLALRLDSHAQKEIRDYAEAVRDLTKPLFPATFEAVGL